VIGLDPVHLDDIIPVKPLPSPKNDPENDPLILYDPVGN
jgi:hypothetical protein